MAFFRISDPATADLEEISAHIAKENRQAAVRLLQQILEKCRLLAARPLIARARSEILPELRSFPVGNYLIFFRIIDGGIEIARVLHGARDLRAVFPE